MIKINKSQLPDGISITREEDYNGGIIRKILTDDSCGKCYICEDSLHTSGQVEHRIPHKGNTALKLDWNNLLLACYHCNTTKSHKYDGILDPTSVDPEAFIDLSLDVDSELREIVVVRKKKGGADVDITVDLLDAVYNGTSTARSCSACQQLKNKLSNELLWFLQEIVEYLESPNTNSQEAIAFQLSDKSIFAAFKRKIIRDDLGLALELFSFQN
ncbi:MAG: HNH endonuclease [Clostridiales Family XIII bacterium]|jgi:hypothetical protein|nr:HNH endonuclease [Clostridiales Family XIII bacterium]